MKSMSRCLAVLALGFGLVGLIGCAQDNETAAQITGVAPSGNAQSPKTQADMGSQMRGAGGGMSNQAYPGAAKQQSR